MILTAISIESSILENGTHVSHDVNYRYLTEKLHHTRKLNHHASNVSCNNKFYRSSIQHMSLSN